MAGVAGSVAALLVTVPGGGRRLSFFVVVVDSEAGGRAGQATGSSIINKGRGGFLEMV